MCALLLFLLLYIHSSVNSFYLYVRRLLLEQHEQQIAVSFIGRNECILQAAALSFFNKNSISNARTVPNRPFDVTTIFLRRNEMLLMYARPADRKADRPVCDLATVQVGL